MFFFGGGGREGGRGQGEQTEERLTNALLFPSTSSPAGVFRLPKIQDIVARWDPSTAPLRRDELPFAFDVFEGREREEKSRVLMGWPRSMSK